MDAPQAFVDTSLEEVAQVLNRRLRQLRQAAGDLHSAALSDFWDEVEALAQRLQAEAHRQRQALSDARRLQDNRNVLLAMLGHELRAPISPVLSAVTALEAQRDLPHPLPDWLSLIRRNIEFEARLIDDLLVLSRSAFEHLRIDPEPLDAHATIDHVATLCRADIDAKRITLDVDLAAREHHVHADPTRCQQVIWNLLRNAVKFTPEDGHIRIRTANTIAGAPATVPGVARSVLMIEVSDSGMGIEPDVLPRLFNPFEQGGESVQGRYGGLGLGLAIARILVEAHGGSINADSLGAGQGATFTICLPVLPAPRHIEPAPATAPDICPATTPLRILLVEDHVDTLRITKQLLEGLGHHVAATASAEQALQLVNTTRFDLLISDLTLPRMGGCELLQAIRRHYPIRGIVTSGCAAESVRQRCAVAGFSEYLVKPVNFEKFQAAVRRAVSS